MENSLKLRGVKETARVYTKSSTRYIRVKVEEGGFVNPRPPRLGRPQYPAPVVASTLHTRNRETEKKITKNCRNGGFSDLVCCVALCVCFGNKKEETNAKNLMNMFGKCIAFLLRFYEFSLVQ